MPVLETSRAEAIDVVSATLLARASRLTRVLLRQGKGEFSRTESGLLTTLLDGPRRVTELAATETLAQPTVTQLVDRLARRGLVTRLPSPDDGRVVLVAISEEGRGRLEAARAHMRSLLRDIVTELDDADLAGLVAASETLGRLLVTTTAGARA